MYKYFFLNKNNRESLFESLQRLPVKENNKQGTTLMKP